MARVHRVADKRIVHVAESASFSPDTNLDLSPKPSKSSPPCLTGLNSWLSPHLPNGPHTPRTHVPKFSSPISKPSEVRVYLEGVLLDRCREDMRMNGGKLNVHLYEALKKSLYKPAAFFKGVLFPLCEVRLSFSFAAKRFS